MDWTETRRRIALLKQNIYAGAKAFKTFNLQGRLRKRWRQAHKLTQAHVWTNKTDGIASLSSSWMRASKSSERRLRANTRRS